ncbi:hypothetical protein QBC37DRAFT_488087 [Rhypophila decipiens]|uniref:Uncharacterized protein n=1 Tax=Rhypophila decipiens TaxID=261697 RepID=A0AAN6XTB3_9PEZI|nr:hypothetical protein QBC37DRAFT_488087 [Rhypophila decipiens]
MSSANASFLSSPKYGYDFVVSTTQASINSGLLELLSHGNKPETYLCFLADEDGNPSKQMALDELLKLTGGVNPFDIPNNTPYSDPRITTLTQNITSAKNQGLPLVAVTAVSQSAPDASQLQLAAYERQVSRLKDAGGVLIPNPTPQQAAVTTLDYICSVTNTLPAATPFGWNWMLPQDVDSESGVIAINRNVIGRFIMDQILTKVNQSCFTATTSVTAHWYGEVTYRYSFTGGAQPQTVVVNPVDLKDTSKPVVSIAFQSYSRAHDKSGATAGELRITPNYNCDVYFTGTTIQVKQKLLVAVYARWDETGDTINAVDKTIIDTYNISVNGGGVVTTEKAASTTVDNSQNADRSSIVNFFTGINDLVNDIKNKTKNIVETSLQPIQFNDLQKFVFPGAKVFTYKSASFSEGQDLICYITYLDPTSEAPSSPAPPAPTCMLTTSEICSHPVSREAAPTAGAAPVATPAPRLILTHESDLMQNYLQGQIVSPQGIFKALQTDDGHALLFSIDSSHALHVIHEKSGESRTGWEMYDMSAAAVQAQFAGQKDAIVRTFDAGQSALDQTISLAMAVSAGGSDHPVSLPGSWSTPVPLLSGIERVSAYSNVADGGNTIFASGGGKLQKLTQATDTAKGWYGQEITLAAAPTEKSLSFNSYTTIIHVADEKNNLPAAGVEVALSAKTRTPVYINGLYYVLGQAPTTVKTDGTGALTVIEVTQDISGTALTVSADGGQSWKTINPMDKSFQKLTALDSEDKLRKATVRKGAVAGGIVGSPSTGPLINPATSNADAKALANSLASLKTVYTALQTPVSPAALAAPPTAPSHRPSVVPATLFLSSVGDFGSDLAIAAGDLFQWLESGVEAVVSVIKDAVSDAWHFIATIGKRVYRAVLDTVDAVVGAVKWVFDAVKTAIEDVIRFVEFLLEWDDIRRTKEVMHNVILLYLRKEVSGLATAKVAFDNQIAAAEEALNSWAGISDWPSLLGESASKPCAGSASNPMKGQTPGSLLLAHHYQHNAGRLSITSGDGPTVNAAEDAADILLRALTSETKVVAAVGQLMEQLAVKLDSISIGDALKAIAAILADGVLSSAQVVVDALLDLLVDLADSAIGALDTKIHIPIISDILNALGVHDISLLDLFTWIGAVAYTVVYKAANDGAAPFPSGNAGVDAIISATSWEQLFPSSSSSSPPAPLFLAPAPNGSATTTTTTSSSASSPLFITCHVFSGFFSLIGTIPTVLDAESDTASNPYYTPGAVLLGVSAGLSGAADALSPRDPIHDSAMSVLGKATTGGVIISAMAFCGPAQKLLTQRWGAGVDPDAARVKGAMLNAVLTIPALAVSGWHVYELSRDQPGATRSAGTVGEVSNVARSVGTIAYAAAVADEDPESRQVAVGVLAVSGVVVGGCRLLRG